MKNLNVIIGVILLAIFVFGGFVIYRKTLAPTENQTAERMFNLNPTITLSPGLGGCVRADFANLYNNLPTNAMRANTKATK